MGKDKDNASSTQDDTDIPNRGPLGDVLPGREKQDPRTGGGLPAEKVEDRPNVGSVTPEDYPEQQ